AKSVYVGVVRVEPEARGSSSNQANRNLLLSEKAKATSEPILEILNNDILRCSHGATVGPVDPEHLFYLESRGIPRPTAERMLVQGFLGEILDRLPVAQVRDAVDQEMSVECPRHGSRFDVRTGQVTGLPAVIPAKTYPVTVENGEIFVELRD